jgi:RHS repeat-associated protein
VVKNAAGQTQHDDRFVYDPNDMRIGMSQDGVNPFADFNGAGALQYHYLYGLGMDTILARADASGNPANTAFYLTDQLGSVRIVTNVGRGMLDQLTYDSFGKIIGETGSFDRFKWEGREWLPELGLYDFRARYYSVSAGHFLSGDPLGLGPDENPYRFVGNDSPNAMDPSGLEGTDPAEQRQTWTQAAGNVVKGFVKRTTIFGTVMSIKDACVMNTVEDQLVLPKTLKIKRQVEQEGAAKAIEDNLGLISGGADDAVRLRRNYEYGIATGDWSPFEEQIGGTGGDVANDVAGLAMMAGAPKGRGLRRLSQMTAAERRAFFIAKGVPENEIGPGGFPKVHVVERATLKEAEEAARQAGKGKPIKHTQDAGQATHFHAVDEEGNKLAGGKNVHFQKRGDPPNPEK